MVAIAWLLAKSILTVSCLKKKCLNMFLLIIIFNKSSEELDF